VNDPLQSSVERDGLWADIARSLTAGPHEHGARSPVRTVGLKPSLVEVSVSTIEGVSGGGIRTELWSQSLALKESDTVV